MSIRAQTDGGRIMEFPSAAELWAFIEAEARRKHPERYAPDGTALTALPGDTWAEKLAEWHERYDEAPIPDEVASS